jgi:hypothetical protein
MSNHRYPIGSSSIVNQKPTLYDKSHYETNEFWGKMKEKVDKNKGD